MLTMEKMNIFCRVLFGIVSIGFLFASGLLALIMFDSLLNKINAAVFLIMGIKFGHLAITGKDKIFIRFKI